jgi:hypothetical protein
MLRAGLAIGLALVWGPGASLAQTARRAEPHARSVEGDWLMIDSTDNNTGEREVYALHHEFFKDEQGFLTLMLRCFQGRPTFFVDWTERDFPDQTVLTFSPIPGDRSNPADGQFVFEKSTDPVDRGLRASTETSAQIISSIGKAPAVAITAHFPSKSRTRRVAAGEQLPWTMDPIGDVH